MIFQGFGLSIPERDDLLKILFDYTRSGCFFNNTVSLYPNGMIYSNFYLIIPDRVDITVRSRRSFRVCGSSACPGGAGRSDGRFLSKGGCGTPSSQLLLGWSRARPRPLCPPFLSSFCSAAGCREDISAWGAEGGDRFVAQREWVWRWRRASTIL